MMIGATAGNIVRKRVRLLVCVRRGNDMSTRLYHLVAINEKNGWKEYLTAFPMTHEECCTMKAKFSAHPARRIQLEEVKA